MSTSFGDAPRTGLRRLLGTSLVVIALVATVATGVALADPALVVDHLPGAAPAPVTCPTTEVEVAVAAEVATDVEQALQPLLGTRLPGGSCLAALVQPQEPADTLATLAMMPAQELPAVWVPDSSFWTEQAPASTVHTAGSFATSPVVLATSQAAVTTLGWGSRAPTWAQALNGQRAVAVPDLATSATGLLAVLALRSSAGGGARADSAVAATVLAAQRADAPTPADALRDGAADQAGAPLVPASEQLVFSADRASEQPALVAVYPSDGSPSLDYPVVQLVARRSVAEQAAVDAVVAGLLSPAARRIAVRDGFREPTAAGQAGSGAQPGSAGPSGAGVRTGAVAALALPPPAQVRALVARLNTLAVPIRMLAVVDVSLSMASPVTPTDTRIQLVRDAAKNALQLFPDTDQIGIWAFSQNITPGVDHVQVQPLLALSQSQGAGTHRAQIAEALDQLPSSLGGTGTALYSTALAAVRSMVANYDPRAANDVVLLTDGVNDATGLDLATLVAQLHAIDTSARPVRLITIGIGPDADLSVLSQLAGATPNGHAYLASSTEDLQTVLYSALSARQ